MRIAFSHTLFLVSFAILPCSADAQTPSDPPVEPATLETIHVSAQPDSALDERRNASTAKIIVSREDLEKMDAATIGEILRQLPGVSLAAESEGGRRGRARAVDRLEPRIVVDGEPLPGGNRNALRLPVELIEKIEIIRNSTPEFPSGPGGTINLILRDTPPKKAGNFRAGISYDGDAFGGRVSGSYGDREGESGVIAMGFADTRPTTGSRAVSRETFAAGARTGWDVETDADEGLDSGAHLMARYTRDLGAGSRLVVSPMLFGRDIDRRSDTRRYTYADPVSGTGLTADGRERETESKRNLNGRLSLDWKQRRPGQGETSAQLMLQGESETGTRNEDDFDAADTLLTRTRTRDTRSGQGATFKGKHSQALADTHLATFGLEARYKTTLEKRSESVNGVDSALGAQARADSTERELALWAQDEWQIADGHLLTPGLRAQAGDRAVTDGLGATIADASAAWLPSLHYLWQLNPRWNVRAGLAWAEKAPDVRELSPVVRTANGVNSLSNPDRAGNPALRPESTATLQAGIEHFLADQRGSAGLNFFLRDIDDKVQKRTALEADRYVERPFNVARATETSVVADFKWNLAALPALTLRGNVSTSRIETEETGAAFVRQESPRHAANLGADYDWAEAKLSFGGNLSYSSGYTREANPDTEQTQRARTQLDLYAVKKLDRALSLRLSIDNVTREGRGDDTLEYAGGALHQREIDHADGMRVVNLSLEGKWCARSGHVRLPLYFLA